MNITPLQEDFTLMMSVTLEKAARNVPMDLLFTLTKRQEHQSKIASPVQKVTIKKYFRNQKLDFDCSKHLDARCKRCSPHAPSSLDFRVKADSEGVVALNLIREGGCNNFRRESRLNPELKHSVQIEKKYFSLHFYCKNYI